MFAVFYNPLHSRIIYGKNDALLGDVERETLIVKYLIRKKKMFFKVSQVVVKMELHFHYLTNV